MHTPCSTYRVQLNKSFTLNDLSDIIDYLSQLGITTIYAAPLMKATPGSVHGYDVTDYQSINPEVGTLADLQRITGKLKDRKMTWIQDIVPNHMAFNVENYRLMDVLERHKASPFFNHFDIDWNHPAPHLNGKLQVPFLGSPLRECIERSEIRLSFGDRGFTVDYEDTQYPLSLTAYPFVFDTDDAGVFAWRDFVGMAERSADYQDWKNDKESYLAAVLNSESSRNIIQATLNDINNNRHRLLNILDQLYYRLCWWKDTERQINYRRFFTVNELIGLRMEDDTVFDDYHQFIHELYKNGLIQGLRIDHIDGLQDPAHYTQRLRKLFGDECYIVAEKILERNETIPRDWPIQGTSGYEFLSFLNQLITNREGAREMVDFYRTLVPEMPAYNELVREKKKLILQEYMQGEWDNVTRRMENANLLNGFSLDQGKEALGELMISLPVYRAYPSSVPLEGETLALINRATSSAMRNSGNSEPILRHLHEILTNPTAGIERDGVLSLLQKIMQLTGPLTAKGVEDTTFYLYNALISHDEVGDAPGQLGMSIQNFHQRMIQRMETSRLSLNATSTHDTKRGEDGRLRLNLLCEFTSEWCEKVEDWFKLNAAFRTVAKGNPAPVKNDEYYIYQAIVGGFPADLKITEEWVGRLIDYVTKVVREAKINSNWSDPNIEYEAACQNFIRQLFKGKTPFLNSLLPFLEKVLLAASDSVLTAVALKMLAPGIPDTYQGCELWDLSFVDPDNRRPVDFELRRHLLAELVERSVEDSASLRGFLIDHRALGVEKLFVTWKLLQLRAARRDVFIEGEYVALDCTGGGPATIGFARHRNGLWVLLIAQLQPSLRPGDQTFQLGSAAPRVWQDVLFGESFKGTGLKVAELCARLPIAVLVGQAGM